MVAVVLVMVIDSGGCMITLFNPQLGGVKRIHGEQVAQSESCSALFCFAPGFAANGIFTFGARRSCRRLIGWI